MMIKLEVIDAKLHDIIQLSYETIFQVMNKVINSI